jgi:ubiquinone/menaquinone biosynthesis C-methylase UbiE
MPQSLINAPLAAEVHHDRSGSHNARACGNLIRGPFNALLFTAMDAYLHRLLSAHKVRLFHDLPKEIVELGPGVGANFRYFPKGTQVTAIEPNPHMHRGLRRAARTYGIALTIQPSGAERIDLADSSVEAVVCTLVLCTVANPAACLAEVRRILRPGGRLLFLEHVAAPEGSWRRRLQDAVHGAWHYCFEGCHTNRHTLAHLEAAGFSTLMVEQYKMASPFLPANLQIAGVATE